MVTAVSRPARRPGRAAKASRTAPPSSGTSTPVPPASIQAEHGPMASRSPSPSLHEQESRLTRVEAFQGAPAALTTSARQSPFVGPGPRFVSESESWTYVPSSRSAMNVNDSPYELRASHSGLRLVDAAASGGAPGGAAGPATA